METWSENGIRYSLYDLSQRLSNKTGEFEPNPHHIEYVSHAEGVADSPKLFGIEPDAWRNGCAWAIERVTLTTHSGTHLDAPYHYGPTSGGRPAKTIDEVPLRWCIGSGVVIDVQDIDRRVGATEEDMERKLADMGYSLRPYDIVLIRTGASAFYDQPGYQYKHTGLRESATRWLVERGVRMIGIDAWTLDRAFDVMVEEARAGDTRQLWESHYYGMEREYCQIEKLTGLDELPARHGFQVMCLPVRIEGASGAWARVVAQFSEPEDTAG